MDISVPDYIFETIAEQLRSPNFRTVAATESADTIVGFHSRDLRSRAFNPIARANGAHG